MFIVILITFVYLKSVFFSLSTINDWGFQQITAFKKNSFAFETGALYLYYLNTFMRDNVGLICTTKHNLVWLHWSDKIVIILNVINRSVSTLRISITNKTKAAAVLCNLTYFYKCSFYWINYACSCWILNISWIW